MDRDLDQHQQQTHLQQKHQPMNSSLTRYQSAPSSYFANLADSDSRDVGYGGGKDLDQLLNSRALSPETQRIFRRFMFNTSGADNPSSYNQPQIARNASGIQKAQSQFETQMKNTGDVLHHQNEQQQLLMEQQQRHQQNSDFSTASQMIYRGHSQPNQNIFCSINVKDGRMRNQMEYSSGLPPSSSSSGLVSQISESGRKSMGIGASEDANFAEGHRTLGEYITAFSISSWDDDSTTMSDKFLKGFGDNDQKSFSNPDTSENQRSESGNRPPTILSHHLSLPKSSELSSMEKFLQFQDMVPCQMRAKRGFATHPRSIAERVRRTRISERMRKLQELVPNMDKQTNTSDMLDLAVDYIKDLKNQVKALSENRAKFKCSNKHKS